MGWIPFERKGDFDEMSYREYRVRRFCGALCVLLVIAVIALGVVTLIAYLVLRPHATHYAVVSATVPTLQVVGASTSLTDTSAVNAQFTYGVELRNPNGRVTMEYTKLHVQTTYLGADIGHSGVNLGGLRVGHRSSSVATVTMSGTSVVVSNIIGNALRNDINQQSVTVHVRIDTRTRAHVGSYTSFWMWLHAVCDVTVSPPNGGVNGALMRVKCHNT